MLANDLAIWEAVRALEGMNLETYVDSETNTVVKVTDNEVLIKNRSTKPLREDSIAAYRLLFNKGMLRRTPDLAWLAGPSKKTSSIVFRIVGEIARDEAAHDPRTHMIIATNRNISRT